MSMRTALVRASLARCYALLGQDLERVHDGCMPFFDAGRYQPPAGRYNGEHVLVQGPVITVLSYSSDVHEPPRMQVSHHSLRRFLRDRMKRHIGQYGQRMLFAEQAQWYCEGKGDLDTLQTVRIDALARRRAEQDLARVDSYLDGSLFIRFAQMLLGREKRHRTPPVPSRR